MQRTASWGRTAFPLQLSWLFLESMRILERRVGICAAARRSPTGRASAALHPRQGHSTLDPFLFPPLAKVLNRCYNKR